MGSDDESGSDAGSRHTAGSALDSVPVDVSGDAVGKLRCKLCNSKATEMSPLPQSSDMYKLHLEWRLYHKNKIQDKVVSKRPRGRLCNWCCRTFYLLGWNDEFADIQDYTKTISTTNKEKHKTFLTSRTALIKDSSKTASGPGIRTRTSHSGRKDVNQAAVTLDTVTAETRRMKKPRMQFVTTDAWDEQLDGKFDTSKEKHEDCFGKEQKGIWKMMGREGVFDADHFEDKTVEERTREADDSGPLGALRMEHKREKIRSLLDTNEKAQKEAAVDGGPATTMQDILGLLKSAGHGKVSASGDGNGDEPSSSSASDSSDDSSDEEHAADLAGGRAKQRLESFCNAAQKRPVGGASGIATGSAHGSGDNARKKPATATAGAVAKNTAASKSSGSARGSGPDVGSVSSSRALAHAPQHESVSMDGRSLRLRASLEKEGQEIATKIPLLVTDFLGDEEKCVWDDPPSREKTKKGLADIKKEAGKLVATLKLASKRFSNASGPGQAAAEGAKQEIDSSMHMLELIQRFLTLLCMPQPPLDDFSTAMDEMTSNGVRFTKSLYKYAFWLKARSLMQFERYDELCEMSDFNRDLQKLLDCNMSRSDVADYASIVLQQCISERLTALKEDRVALPISEYRERKLLLPCSRKSRQIFARCFATVLPVFLFCQV